MSDCTSSPSFSLPIENSGAERHLTPSVSAGLDAGISYRQVEERAQRWRLVEVAGDVLERHRDAAGKSFATCICCKYLAFGEDAIELRYDDARRRGRLARLNRCNSVWLCAWCSWYIAQGRCAELERALFAMADRGCSVLFATHTLSHKRYDALRDTLGALKGALRDTLHSRPVRALRARYGLFGYVRGIEVTYAELNGFHPHGHYLWFSDRRLSAADCAEFEEQLYGEWSRAVAASHRAAARERFKVKVVGSDDVRKLAKYLSGAAAEITKSHVKRGHSVNGTHKHYTMFELLELFADDKRSDLRKVFVEYAKVLKGTAQVYWSPGLKGAFGIEDVSDDALVADMSTYAPWAWLHYDQVWFTLLRKRLRPQLQRLLDAKDRDGIVAMLRELGAVGDVLPVDKPEIIPSPPVDYGAKLVPDLLAWRAANGYADSCP